ncbi:MAG: hypothetical protein K2J42_08930 [Muribaculaceae bacterium]|nr:hypothetical protein [Muribaculaceae bacterium]MDE6810189.1 hypothetical protein [Muribaculaceae bacterium]
MKRVLIVFFAAMSIVITHAVTINFSCGKSMEVSPEVLEYYQSRGKLQWYIDGMDDAVCAQEEKDKDDDSDPLP